MDKEISSKEMLLFVKNTIEEDLLHDDQAGSIVGDRTAKVTEVAAQVFNKSFPIYEK
jgi:hypothetical protein